MPDSSQSYFSSLLVGIIDGIIIPMTVFSFLVGLGKTPDSIWMYTLYIVVIAAFIMAAGALFTRKEELSRTHEKRIMKVYKRLDVPEAIREDLIKDAARESAEWKNNWTDRAATVKALPPMNYAATIFAGYLVGGIIVLLNAIWFAPPAYLYFIIPCVVLLITGYAKYKMFGRPAIGGMFLTAASGVAAPLAAYWVASIL